MKHLIVLVAASIAATTGAGCAVETDPTPSVFEPGDAVDDVAPDVDAPERFVSPVDVASPPSRPDRAVAIAFAENPRGVAVTERGVFWIDSADWFDDRTDVWLLPAAGGSPVWVTSAIGRAVSLEARDGMLYWIDAQYGRILQAPAIGGPPRVLAEGQIGAYDLAVDGAVVYWTNVERGTITWLDLASGDQSVFVTGQAQPTGIAAARGVVVWTDASDGILKSVTRNGLETVHLAGDRSFGAAPVLNDGHVYFADVELRAILRVPARGGSVMPVAFHQPDPTSIAVADGRIYWASAGNGEIVTKPVEGGPITAIATQQRDPSYLAIGPDAVFWASRHDGTIWTASR